MDNHVPSQNREVEFGLKELVSILWRMRWVILVTTIVSAVVAGTYASLQPKRYTAVTILSPASRSSDNGMGGLNSLASQFGGLAALAGVSLGGDNSAAESMAVLQSNALTQRYIDENKLLPILFAEQWDAKVGNWRVEEPKEVPTLWKAAEYFDATIRKTATEGTTGLITLEITWTDPQVAAQWANGLVRMTNTYLRDKAVTEAERNIAYLTAEAARTDVVGVRQAIYTVLQNEINKVMLARGRDEYALEVIDPAPAPEYPSSPITIFWIAGGLFAGLFLSLLAALLRGVWMAAAKTLTASSNQSESV